MKTIPLTLPRSPRWALVVLISLLLAVAVPAPAAAGPGDGWASISATLYDLQVGMAPTLVVSGLLPEGTELPHEAALAIPKDSSIVWAGELLGMGSDDPMVEFTVEERDTYDLVVFTLTQSPAAQVELTLPEGSVTEAERGLAINLAWTSGGTAERARVAIASPQVYHLEGVTPEPTVEVRENDVLYWVESVPVTEGQQLTISGTLVDGAAPELTTQQQAAEETATAGQAGETPAQEEQPSQPEQGPSATWIIIGVLAAALAVVLVFLVRAMRAHGPAE